MVAVSHCLKDIDVLILAGGKGTRIRETLGDTPKILAPIGNTLFLELLVRRLKIFGARRIILALGHLSDKVLSYLDAASVDGVKIVTSIEPEPLGTAGSIRLARSEINTNPVLVMNGDSFYSTDLCKFVSTHKDSERDASILCAHVEDTFRFGQIDISDDGLVRGFLEKSSNRYGAGYINAGVYLFSSKMLQTISDMSGPSLEYDVFEKLSPLMLGAIKGEGKFIDIGTSKDLADAADFLESYI